MPPGPPPPQFLSGFSCVEFTTAYYKRGYLQENREFIAEPILDITIDPFHSDGPLTDLDFHAGTRASFQTNDSHATGSPRALYEGDFWGGFNAIFFKRVKFDTTYVDITSPNSAFSTIQEFDNQPTFIDDGKLGDVSFRPVVGLVQEIGSSKRRAGLRPRRHLP